MKQLFHFSFLLFFFGTMSAQQTDIVDFTAIKGVIDVGYDLKFISAGAIIDFTIKKKTDTIFVDAKHLDINLVKLTKTDSEYFTENFDYHYDESKLYIVYPFKRKENFQLTISYNAVPKKAMYFVNNGAYEQIWTQGQGKYTSHWLPSIDDVNDKINFEFYITCDKAYSVLSNGKLIAKEMGNRLAEWHYKMEKPMSSYLVALAIGKYDKQTETSKSGIPLEYYYYPEDSLKVEPTYRYTKQIFDYLEDEIGFPYPWQNYKQVPVKDFLYSGMENTSLTIFSDSFMVDSTAYNDRNYVTVNAHELAHQWFGDLVTATSGEHHWLQEGFATYYALLAERHVFGDDHYYWQLFENAQELIAHEAAGQSTSLLDPKSSSTTFYKKGAWALHVLRAQVGDSAFKSAVKTYLEKHQFENVTTTDFISEVENASGQDLTTFVNDWLMEVKLPEDAIVESLKQSAFMQEYFMVDCEVFTSKCTDYLASDISDKAKIKVVSQIAEKIDARAFQNSLEVRQAISRYVDQIPLELKPAYESLLNDKSYSTIEAAMYNLWVNFPQERVKFLQKTKDIIGFNDYNVKLLWLALHLNTVEYQSEKKQAVLDELIGYSLPKHHFELRMNAFNYLKLLGAFEIESIKSLLLATKHHNWRFAKFAKDMLSELENDLNYKLLIGKLKTD